MALNGNANVTAGALPRFSAATRLMVVAPHPDDETIACGVLIQQVVAAGGAVQVLLLTDGENNPWPQRWLERRWRVGAAERERWGRKRQIELHEILPHLGLAPDSLRLMGWPDLGVTARLLSPTADSFSRVESLAQMAEAITGFGPSLLVFPALADRHPDHSAAYVLVKLALAGLSTAQTPQQFVYLVHGKSAVTDSLEISGNATQRARKMAALQCYRSQMALSAGRLRRMAGKEEQYVDVSAEHPPRARHVLPWAPAWWLRPWLRLTVVSQSDVVSWRWHAVPFERNRHREHRLYPCTVGFAGRRFAKLTCDLPLLWIFDLWGWHEL